METLGYLKIILIFANGIMYWTSTIVALSKTVLMIMDKIIMDMKKVKK